MRKIILHLKENWIRYGFETIVVTVGIVGAFTLNSWNESRGSQETEIKLLKEMVTGLNNDLYIFDDNIRFHNGGYNASQIILESIANNESFNDSLSLYFAMTHNYTVFSPNTGSYESLKSLGIEIIMNDEIRLKIIRLYEQRYSNLQVNIKYFSDYIMDLKTNFNPLHFEEFNFFDLDSINLNFGSYGGRMTPINYEELKTNQGYLYHLRSLQNGHGFIKGYNMEVKTSAENLIKLIQKEIALREN